MALVLVAALGGCAALPASCPAGLTPMRQAELYFGRSIPGGGEVSEADWRVFLDEEVTPRFPDGLTVEDASGQWKDKSAIVREASKHLTLVITGTSDGLAKLEAVRNAYRRRFRQDSVLLTETANCGSF